MAWLAQALGAEEEELMLLAENVPDSRRHRVIERPDAIRKLARLDGRALDRLVSLIPAQG